jgi:hypothetical protein
MTEQPRKRGERLYELGIWAAAGIVAIVVLVFVLQLFRMP